MWGGIRHKAVLALGCVLLVFLSNLDSTPRVFAAEPSTLWAWGCRNHGQLGDGTTTNKTTPTQESTGATNWSTVTAGGFHTIAIPLLASVAYQSGS